MNLVVFAHTPPPFHGQSFMVEQMILELAKLDWRVASGPHKHSSVNQRPKAKNVLYHVNAKVSEELADVGRAQIGKIGKIVAFCLLALWHRIWNRADILYYVPAPRKKSALIRDWIVLLFLRPFFKEVILHWHAAGLGSWASDLENQTKPDPDPAGQNQIFNSQRLERLAKALTRRLHSNVRLAIVITEYNRPDAEALAPQTAAIVHNGVPDPFPDFQSVLLLQRQSRRKIIETRWDIECGKTQKEDSGRQTQVEVINVLYLAHCTAKKGLFDTLEAVALANSQLLEKRMGLRFHLTVAGAFNDREERRMFDRRIEDADLQHLRTENLKISPKNSVTYVGFVSGKQKQFAIEQADCLCSLSHEETFGINVTEAISSGLPVVLSSIGAYQEIFGAVGIFTESFGATCSAKALFEVLSSKIDPEVSRNFFLTGVSSEKFGCRMQAAFQLVGEKRKRSEG